MKKILKEKKRRFGFVNLGASFLILVFSGFPKHGLGAAVPTSPGVDPDFNRTLFYRRLERWVPYLFEETFEWDSKLEDVVSQEREFLDALNTNKEIFPLFKKGWKERKEPKQIIVQSEGKALPAGWVLTTDAELALARAKKEKLLPSQSDEMVKELNDKFALIAGKSPRGILSGLIRQLPKENWERIFRLPPTGQLAEIKKGIPSDVLPPGFDPSRFGLDPKISTNDLLLLVDSLIEVEEKISLLGVALARSQHGDRSTSQNPADFPVFAGLEKPLRERVALALRSAYERKDSGEREKKPELILVEMPPYLAAYRGLIGGDCSTSNSPFYPYSPKEYDYFIYRPNGALAGYLGATEVSAGKEKKALYIHDVTGRDLSVRELNLAVHGLFNARKKLGFSEFLIATQERLDANMHFAGLIGRLTELSENSTVRVQHQDLEIRDFIGDNVSSRDYDDASENSKAHWFKPDLSLAAGLSFEIEASPVNEYEPEAPSRIEALLLAAKLVAADQKASGEKVIVENGFERARFGKIESALKNEKKKKLVDFYAESRKILGLSAPGQSSTWKMVRRDKSWVFDQGHRNAKDFFVPKSPEFREKSFALFLREVKTALNNGAEMRKSNPMRELWRLLNSIPRGQLKESGFLKNPRFARAILNSLPEFSQEDIRIGLGLVRSGHLQQEKVEIKAVRVAEVLYDLGELIEQGMPPEHFEGIAPAIAVGLKFGRIDDEVPFGTLAPFFLKAIQEYPQCIPNLAAHYFAYTDRNLDFSATNIAVVRSMETYFENLPKGPLKSKTFNGLALPEVVKRLRSHRILLQALMRHKGKTVDPSKLTPEERAVAFKIKEPEVFGLDQDDEDRIGSSYAEALLGYRFYGSQSKEFVNLRVESAIEQWERNYSKGIDESHFRGVVYDLSDMLESGGLLISRENMRKLRASFLALVNRASKKMEMSYLAHLDQHLDKFPGLKKDLKEWKSSRLAQRPFR